MVPEHPAAVTVGPVEGHGAVGGHIHVRHVLGKDALLEDVGFTGRGDPLVGCTVRNPARHAAVQVDGGPVLADNGLAVSAGSSTHDGGVHRQEQITSASGWEAVGEFYADRTSTLGYNPGSQIVRLVQRHAVLFLYVATEADATGGLGIGLVAHDRRQVGVHLLTIFHQRDFIVIVAGIGRGVGNRHRDILPEVVRSSRRHARETIHELPQRRTVGVVALGIIHPGSQDGYGRHLRQAHRERGGDRRQCFQVYARYLHVSVL